MLIQHLDKEFFFKIIIIISYFLHNIILFDCFFPDYGAIPMYFDLMGPHFVIAVRNIIGKEWSVK